jgi:uracil-DNA glycosylase
MILYMDKKLQEKLSYLKWLKHIGIEYYYSDKKDSKNSLMQKLKEASINQKDNQIGKIPIDVEPNQIITSQQNTNAIKRVEKISDTSRSRQLANEANNLQELKIIVENFDGCALRNFAKNTVFCDGNPNSKILLIGEAPGATEDEQGIPFCGESGKLLDKMIGAIGLDRKKNVYITNTIFWRPPANRQPTPQEVEICKPFVEKHIALFNPSLIILIGGTATTALLGKNETISHVRKNHYAYTNQYLNKNIPTAALFHPAFLLRSPYKKKDTWFDLLKIQDYIKQKNLY